MENEKDIKCEVVKQLCILRTSPTGYTKEANIVRWNDGDPKLDIREWNPEHSRCFKGITLSEEETELLFEALVNHRSNN